MDSILQEWGFDNLPVSEFEHELSQFLEPVMAYLPDKRLHRVTQAAIQGIIAAKSPVISEMARSLPRRGDSSWPMAKRLYRLMGNPRFNHRELLKGLYGVAQAVVAQGAPAQLIVALDPVNFEKPYTEALEGVCKVVKSTPPALDGKKRLTTGYPAMTATVVNLAQPVVTYANWFSYETADFVSQNREIYRAIRITRALFPQIRLRFVGDAGLDDQKIFHQVGLVNGEFIIRLCHPRRLQVYNERLERWEEELLQDLVATLPLPVRLHVAFNHARKVREVDMALGWFKIRLPGTSTDYWVLVAHDPELERDLVLITNIPIHSAHQAQTVYTDWRYRSQIEHTYRFDQEDGLDLEQVRVQTLERMRRVFVLVLLAALFVYHIADTWSPQLLRWIRRLGGKWGLASDRDGPYVLLVGMHALFITLATLAFAAHHPFPRTTDTCG